MQIDGDINKTLMYSKTSTKEQFRVLLIFQLQFIFKFVPFFHIRNISRSRVYEQVTFDDHICFTISFGNK